MRTDYRTALLMLGLMAGGLLACSTPSTQHKRVEQQQFWPPPPAAARIEYIRSISGPEDLGIEKSFWTKLGEIFTGSVQYRLIRPMAVVADSDKHTIYVADPGAKGVHRFDQTGSDYLLLRQKDDAPLPSPVALAWGPEQQLYIVDADLGQIFIHTPGTEYVVPMPLEIQLKQPTGIAFDPQSRRLYVVDTGSHQIKVLTPEGHFLANIGKHGAGPGEFNYPTMLWLDGKDRLLVADSLNFRIQILTAEGGYLGQFGKPGDASGNLPRPKGVAVDSQGHIYVVDSMFHSYQVFDNAGNLLLHLGSQGQRTGQFWLPTGLYIDNKDTIYVADTYNRRVQVFRYIGSHP